MLSINPCLSIVLCLLTITVRTATSDPSDDHPVPPLYSDRPANILCLCGSPSRGHHIWNSVVLRALADRGHNLTILTVVDPTTHDTNTSFHRMHYLHMFSDAIYERNLVAAKKSAFAAYLSQTVYGRITARYVEASRIDGLLVDSKAAKQLLGYPEDFLFDLVLHDLHQAQALLGFVDRFGSPPLIGLAPSGLQTASVGSVAGVVNYPSYQPHSEGVYSYQGMSFIERARNLTYFLYDWFYRTYVFMVNENRKARRLFGANMVNLETIESKTSLVLANTDFVLDQAVSLPANVVNVGGLQAQRKELLGEELQRFLDSSENGTIYVNDANLFDNPTQQRYLLMKVFNALSHLNFIWITKEKHLKRLPQHVFASDWVPQSTVLAHRNVKLMITNGGRLSVQESVWHGVPFIVLGSEDHQSQLVRRAIMNGCAASLNVNYTEFSKVVKTIQNVVHSSSFSTVAHRMSQRFQSQPSSPLDRAIHAIESVLLFGDANHLRPSDTHLYFLQTHMVDVWAAFVVLVSSFLFIFIKHCCFRRRSHSRMNDINWDKSKRE